MNSQLIKIAGVFLLSVTSFQAAQPAEKPRASAGVLPVGADGKPLNFDFETGTLKDWTAEGDAFLGQPIKGDTVSPRRSRSTGRRTSPGRAAPARLRHQARSRRASPCAIR